MILFEHTKYLCPSCKNDIDVVAAGGQGLIERIESPSAFRCPGCNSRLVFRPKVGAFRAGALLLTVVPPVAALIELSEIIWPALGLGAGLIIYSFFTNKLTVLESGLKPAPEKKVFDDKNTVSKSRADRH